MTTMEYSPFLSDAGPRVRAPRSPLRTSSISERALAAGLSGVSEAATLLLHELQAHWRETLPWSPQRPDPLHRLLLWIPAAIALPFALLALGWNAFAAFGAFLLACTLWRGFVSRSRRVAVASRVVVDGIAAGLSLECLEPEIVALLQLDPDNDAARLMLALRRLEEGLPLSALLQLAPLRDRHPDAGIVVLLAALAYARLRAYGDAARMLQALRLPPDHVWSRRLGHFAELCRREDVGRARASSDLGPLEG